METTRDTHGLMDAQTARPGSSEMWKCHQAGRHYPCNRAKVTVCRFETRGYHVSLTASEARQSSLFSERPSPTRIAILSAATPPIVAREHPVQSPTHHPGVKRQ